MFGEIFLEECIGKQQEIQSGTPVFQNFILDQLGYLRSALSSLQKYGKLDSIEFSMSPN